MRVKFLNIFAICLVTLAMLSPELVVLAIIWDGHVKAVESQHLACIVNQSSINEPVLAFQAETTTVSQSKNSVQLFDANFVKQLLSATQQHRVIKILEWFFLLLPVALIIFIFLYDRYLAYRTALVQQQVEMLERLWQQSIEP